MSFFIRLLGSSDPEFKSHSAVELIPGGVDSACHPSEVGKMSASMLVSCVGVATHTGLCPIAKETASAAPHCAGYGPNGWINDLKVEQYLHIASLNWETNYFWDQKVKGQLNVKLLKLKSPISIWKIIFIRLTWALIQIVNFNLNEIDNLMYPWQPLEKGGWIL